MNGSTTCAFTGHRTAKLPWGNNEKDPRCYLLRKELETAVEYLYYDRGYRHFISGMALGCDMYFAEAVLALRSEHDDVTLEAAIPCADQAEGWSADHRGRYDRILRVCDKVTVLSPVYTRGCMMARNRYMVDHASLLLACFNGTPGGTMNTILYAKKEGKELLVLDIE